MSLVIQLPEQLTAAQGLAILDAYIEGLERGYILTMTPTTPKENN